MHIKTLLNYLSILLSLFLISFILFSTPALSQGITISHDPVEIFAGDSLTITVNNPEKQKVTIFFDDNPILSNCVYNQCKKTIPNIKEGLHTYYAIIVSNADEETITKAVNVLAKDYNCPSSVSTGPSISIEPSYRLAKTAQTYKIKVTNNIGELDKFTVEYIPPLGKDFPNIFKGSLSETTFDLRNGDSKEITLTITPNLDNWQTYSKFKLKVTTQLTKKSVEACGYFFVGHFIRATVGEGGKMSPDPAFLSQLLLPFNRFSKQGEFMFTKIQLTAKPLTDYKIKQWEIDGKTSDTTTVTLDMDKDYEVKLLFETKSHVCRGTYSLTFMPTNVKPSTGTFSHYVTFKVKGFETNCDGKSVEIVDNNDKVQCTCEVNKGSCFCISKTAEETGTLTYTAKIDRNSDGDFNDVFFGEKEQITNKLTVSTQAAPLCNIETPQKVSGFEYGKNAKYKFNLYLFNLPEDLKKIKFKCDANLQEQIIDIEPKIPMELTCDYSNFLIPKAFTISMYAPQLPECTQKIKDFLPPQKGTITLLKGWNLISPPNKEPISTDCELIANIFGFSASDGKYFVLNALNQMISGNGYWIKVKEDCTIRFYGAPTPFTVVYPHETFVDLGKWNLVGTAQNKELTIEEINKKMERCEIAANIFAFNPATQSYVVVDKIVPGYGYWIKVKSSSSSPCTFY